MSQTAPQKDFEVAVVGGGVVGLTCTIALQKAGVPVQLFEAASAFGEIGAGIGLGSNAVALLKQLGLWEDVLKRGNSADLNLQSFAYSTGVGEHKTVWKFPAVMPDDEALGIHRADFLDALVSHVNPANCHFHKRLTNITESPTNPKRLLLHFLDGTTHETDVVLGADGIKSAVRKVLLGGKDDHVAFSNTVAYRGLIPYADLQAAGFKMNLADNPACVMGLNKHFIIFLVRGSELVNVVAFSARYDIEIGDANLRDGAPWVELSTKEELKKVYEGWGPDISILLDHMPEQPSKWSIHVVHPPLESYSKGRIALLGDAAHGMLPHMGAGAGQGLEDAYMAARLLGHPSTNASNIEAVLEVYSEFRKPRAQMVWDGSRYTGKVYDGNGPHGLDFEKIQEDLPPKTHFYPVWHHDFEEEFGQVVSLLRERGAFA
ncbi:FAD/NAD-P-binding domain-containing protein [Trametes polyzona]|nr:FAD/NAD-P-binding domain-containing protein [Trametes polyzona]